MPAFFLDTPDILPLPSLQAYTTISFLLLSCSVYYAFQVTSEPDWKLNATLNVGLILTPDLFNSSQNEYSKSESILNVDGIKQRLVDISATFNSNINNFNVTHVNETSLFSVAFLLDNAIIVRLIDVMYLMFNEPLCVWTIINMAYCCLILIGKIIQKLVFGELRVSEQQHVKDRFWNFVFYKFIFIFGVINVQYMDEVVLWCSWFSILGFLSLLAQLCKDRFEYLSFSPMTPKWTHIRLLLLLFTILMTSFSSIIICIIVGLNSGMNTFLFMSAECILVSARTLYVIIRYIIHLWDLNHLNVWENRSSYIYYTEFIFELAILSIDFFHHLHMLIWGNIILSMASLVILMQLRFLFYEIKRRIRKHKNYLQVVRLMEANFPMASKDELLKNSDDCAICWDKMETARKLPCGHLFHNSCLRSWLEQDTSCPTCRTSLKKQNSQTNSYQANNMNVQDDETNNINVRTNHFFHFDGSRYASWLPSVSVEVTRPNLLSFASLASREDETQRDLITNNNNNNVINTPQIDTMAQQVYELFPSIPIATIMDDIQSTRSVELTIENILDGRIELPPEESSSSEVLSEISNSAHSSISNNLNQISTNENLDESRSETSVRNRFFSNEYDCSSESTNSSIIIESLSSIPSTSTSSLSSSNGARFSKSPVEREQILAKRKEDLLKKAKEKYLEKKEKLVFN